MTTPYTSPKYNLSAFNCPICNAYSNQNWYRCEYYYDRYTNSDIWVTICAHCSGKAYWYKEQIIVPTALSNAPLPHSDMPAGIKEDYMEARSIVNQSPRGAMALLRLSVQKLTKELGEPGKNINNDIKSLVQKGLPLEVQQSFDVLRVIGNEAVHPGTIDVKDNIDMALSLFHLINFIVEDQITRKKNIQSLYNSLPQNKKDEIARRDGTLTT